MVIGFRGLSIDQATPLSRALNNNMLGGVILFDYDVASKTRPRNISSPQQLQQLTSSLQSSTQIPLFIMVDQEGGKVARLNETNGYSRGLSASNIAAMNNQPTIIDLFDKVASQLASSGINVNLAPVVDLCSNPDNPIIARLDRCFSADPNQVSQVAALFMDSHKKYNVLTSLKHFPGHGSSQHDSHLGYVDVSTSWSANELQPFNTLIKKNQVDMIMVAHVFNKHIDPVWPASLSYKTIHDLLIEQLGFKGLIISDDLQMAALQHQYSEEEILHHAILAGNDLLVYGNNLKYDEDILFHNISIVKKLLNEGKISESRIEQSWRKIERIKQQLK